MKSPVKNLRTLLYEWSKAVKLKDNYTCRVCGYAKDKRFLHAHHVKQKSEYPELMFNISNGICVCIYCHGKVYHKKFVKFVIRKPKGTTTKDFYAFLAWQKENNIYAKTKPREKSKTRKYKITTKKEKTKKVKVRST